MIDPQELVKKSVIYVHQDMTMADAVRLMIDQSVSSILIHNDADHIVGIITERDIVCKFTLLEFQHKLLAKVNTVMTRPVRFVHINRLNEDIRKLYRETGVRHFPIVGGEGAPTKASVLGMMTATDVFRNALSRSEAATADGGERLLPQVVVVCGNPVQYDHYSGLFTALGCEVLSLNPGFLFPLKKPEVPRMIVFDLDGFDPVAASAVIKQIKEDQESYAAILTSELKLIQPFRNHLDKAKKHVFLKPLDVSYLAWLAEQCKSSQI